MKLKLTICLTLITIFSSCELIDRTKRMDENTQSMSNTTKDMSNTTDKMSRTTEKMSLTTLDMLDITKLMSLITKKMSKKTSNMIFLSRSKESEATRSTAFKQILENKTFESKVKAAAVYFKSFEYQLWTNGLIKADTVEFRHSLMKSAVEEFFRSLSEVTNSIDDKQDISPRNQGENEQVALYAIAITLHMNHDMQEKIISEDNIKEENLYKMIEESLFKYKNLQEKGLDSSSMLEYESSILTYQYDSLLLLNARYNMLLTMALAKSSTLSIDGIFQKIAKSMAPWESVFICQNEQTQDEIIKFIKGALKTKKLLMNLGYNVKYDSSLSKILSNMKSVSIKNINNSRCKKLFTKSTGLELLNDQKGNKNNKGKFTSICLTDRCISNIHNFNTLIGKIKSFK